MKFISLNGVSPKVSFREALLRGIAPDKGLYVPENLPVLPSSFLNHLGETPLIEIGTTVASALIDDVPLPILRDIIGKTFHFPVPLKKLTDDLFLLELFHGPTLAFKDIGARFMAEALAYFLAEEKKHITIIVATSGDTGSAVARGFYQVPGIDVYILYPAGKVSFLQEKQMATLGENIHPVAVSGTFDDCQHLVKLALADEALKAHCNLTTANSINVGRLLPQMIYYFLAIAQLHKIDPTLRPTIVVPSGNFGNLTAAAYAKAMGAPIKQLVAATNSNDVVPQYLTTGHYGPQTSRPTLSNAMDVGNPNNFVRLRALYHDNLQEIQKEIKAFSISDAETIAAIQETFKNSNTVIDPHTAVGVAAAKKLNQKTYAPIIVAATAHPGKFPEVMLGALNQAVDLPPALQEVMHRPTLSVPLAVDFEAWKKLLLKGRSCN